MTHYRSLSCLLLLVLLASGCTSPGQNTPTATQVQELSAENQRLQTEYNQLLVRVEELDEAFRTTGFLEPQVLVEPVTFTTQGQTLQQVLERGTLRCGVNIEAPGLGYLDTTTGELTGFDIDFCRALAAAIFGSSGAEQIDPRALTNRSRFSALQAGDVDILLRNTTWTLLRDAALGIDFTGPILYDGAGLLVPKESNVESLLELAGETICATTDSRAQAVVEGYYALFGEKVEIDDFPDADSARRAYERGGCAALAGDRTTLLGQRLQLAEPETHVILEEEMSREPLAPAVRHNDSNWRDVVTWVVQCTLNAEYLGVSQSNVERMRSSEEPTIRRLLGELDEMSTGLGLRPDFCYQVVAQVGNYADIYRRHLGPTTPYSLPRGLNSLYNNGGILYPIPFQ